jgi:hypothetical protein
VIDSRRTFDHASGGFQVCERGGGFRDGSAQVSARWRDVRIDAEIADTSRMFDPALIALNS